MNTPTGGVRGKEHETDDSEASTASEGAAKVSNARTPRGKAAGQSAGRRVFAAGRGRGCAEGGSRPETRSATLGPVAILEGTQVNVTSAQPRSSFPRAPHTDPHTARLAPAGHCARGCDHGACD